MRHSTDQRFADLKKTMDKFRAADNQRAISNLVKVSFIFFASTLILSLIMTFSSSNPQINFPLLASYYLLTGLCIVKIFTIQHDCGHNSYFNNSTANRALGRVCAIITFIPFTAWNEEHLEHHASFGNLERQTHGDVRLLTIEEFRNSPNWRKVGYFIFRSRWFLLLVAPLLYLLLRQRMPRKLRSDRVSSCFLHTGAILVAYGSVYYLVGIKLLLFAIPSLYVAGVIAMIIFVLEHQFDSAEWTTSKEWSFVNASLASSSFLELPPILEWFTGCIGYHHIHHLNSKIPSYRLRECFLAVANSLPSKRIGLSGIPRNLTLSLWSKEVGKLVTFREARLLKA